LCRCMAHSSTQSHQAATHVTHALSCSMSHVATHLALLHVNQHACLAAMHGVSSMRSTSAWLHTGCQMQRGTAQHGRNTAQRIQILSVKECHTGGVLMQRYAHWESQCAIRWADCRSDGDSRTICSPCPCPVRTILSHSQLKYTHAGSEQTRALAPSTQSYNR
jgi:hypothetical protein